MFIISLQRPINIKPQTYRINTYKNNKLRKYNKMKITAFEFKNNGWSLNRISFNDQNLIVGRNAVGKSMTLDALVLFSQFLRGETNRTVSSHWCNAEFLNDDDSRLYYSYTYNNGIIENETLLRDSELLLKRDREHAFIGEEEVNPPANKLCVQSQRDTTKNPEFESIMNWAEQLKGFSFSELSSTNSFRIPSMFNEKKDFSEMYEQIHQNEEKENFIIEKMKELDYSIEKIDLMNISEKFNIVVLKENNVKVPLFSHLMSNGMLRVFYIFSYLAYISMEQGPKTLLVDDLGEGLDFSRSKKLSKIIFDYCVSHNIQLIVTSNDYFLMNTVGLNLWIILQRQGDITSTLSQNSHPEMFVKFKKMGLNNFDILGTNFIYKYLENSQEA
jgi:predicted ATPase